MEKGRTRSVLLADSRDPGRCLRVTWHPETGNLVFSHWNGAVCAASTPVDVGEVPELVDLLIGALRQAAPGPPAVLGTYQRGE